MITKHLVKNNTTSRVMLRIFFFHVCHSLYALLYMEHCISLIIYLSKHKDKGFWGFGGE